MLASTTRTHRATSVGSSAATTSWTARRTERIGASSGG
ncbi:hypothetical protein UG55_100761 [Frankia sp. EI5c]|nr:hypothetical protein UG55_100761 [Frankia sp. EI5c]